MVLCHVYIRTFQRISHGDVHIISYCVNIHFRMYTFGLETQEIKLHKIRILYYSTCACVVSDHFSNKTETTDMLYLL